MVLHHTTIEEWLVPQIDAVTRQLYRRLGRASYMEIEEIRQDFWREILEVGLPAKLELVLDQDRRQQMFYQFANACKQRLYRYYRRYWTRLDQPDQNA